MAIYASTEVIEGLEKFEHAGANLAEPKAVDAFLWVAGRMRAESGHDDERTGALSAVLVGAGGHLVRRVA